VDAHSGACQNIHVAVYSSVMSCSYNSWKRNQLQYDPSWVAVGCTVYGILCEIFSSSTIPIGSCNVVIAGLVGLVGTLTVILLLLAECGDATYCKGVQQYPKPCSAQLFCNAGKLVTARVVGYGIPVNRSTPLTPTELQKAGWGTWGTWGTWGI
jgi:hypothetical protein